MNAHPPITAETAGPDVPHGAVLDIPLSKLKPSPRNARKTPHGETVIAARAASIAAKGLLQPLVVEPETRDGTSTGSWLVTIGEGRRLALRLLAKRKQIAKTHPVRCIVDLANDPFEISLDENVSRADMHPADQFEAFKALNEEKGWSAEDIAARFGVTAQVVRQRLKLGAVSPRLMSLYREEALSLEQLMAFTVCDDIARQEQVYDQNPHGRQPYQIRRLLTQDKLSARDGRVRFVGLEAYEEAGGGVVRDLFTEDDGGWVENVALIERLASEKVTALAEAIREAEGWKWAEGHLDYPSGHGLGRVHPRPVERTEDERAEMARIAEEYDALVQDWAAVEDLPPEIEARLAEIDQALAAFGDGYAFSPDDLARGGAFVIVSHDGTTRIERGLIRAEDETPPEEDATEAGLAPAPDGAAQVPDAEAEEPDGLTPLSDRLAADLTAHRTLALRDALSQRPDLALLAVTHALVLRGFYAGHVAATCLEVRMASPALDGHADGIADSVAGRAMDARYSLWARQLPKDAADLWPFIVGLDGDSLLSLLAYCAGMSVQAVRTWERRGPALDHADALAQALALDMKAYWTPTASSYLGRVTKARILEAVREGAGEAAASRLDGLKKGAMAEEGERLLAGTGWLPPLLRTGRSETDVALDGDADKGAAA